MTPRKARACTQPFMTECYAPCSGDVPATLIRSGALRHAPARQILFLLVGSVGAAFAQDLVTPSDRVTSFVNIRATPAEDGVDLGDLNIGEALPLLGDVPRWYQVQLPGGGTGFVSKSWTTMSRG